LSLLTGNIPDWATKLDVWSFGVTLWEIIERKRPFHGFDTTGIQSLWLNSPYQARLPPVKIPDTGPPQSLRLMRGLADLVDDCTRLDPDSRPSFGSILQKIKDLVTTP
jgi:serine/threonine protein kinase